MGDSTATTAAAIASVAALVLGGCGGGSGDGGERGTGPGGGEDPPARDGGALGSEGDAGGADDGSAGEDAGCVPTGEEICGNGTDDDCDPSTPDECIGTSCADVLDRGLGAEDGVYEIQPDGMGAPFDVFCDMTTDGGGWTLVANAPEQGYAEIPVVERLTPSDHGQLSVDKIAYLLASPAREENNVRVEMAAPDRVVSMRAVLELGGNEHEVEGPQPWSFNIPWDANDDCAVFDPGPDPADGRPAERWRFNNGSHASGGGSAGSTGFVDGVTRDAYAGFWTNHDTAPDLTCNRDYTPGVFDVQRAGSLWVR